MPSIREQVLDAVASKLNGASKPVGYTAERARFKPVERASLPKALVYVVEEAREAEHSGNRQIWALTLRVETLGTGDPPEEALDAYTTWATKALLADRTLGGVSVEVEEGRAEWNGREADVSLAQAIQEFVVKYVRLRTDPEAQN